MNDPLIARFADACGATAPLDLRVDLAGGGLLAEGSVAQPFTLVGRDDSCDVTLSDPDINPRHAWLQVLGGRVFAVDLGSRTGLEWPAGGRGSGWLDAGNPAKIGPFILRLNAPAGDHPGAFPSDYNPLATDSEAKAQPSVALEFRNGKRVKDCWHVNRLITLIGRSSDCKIHLTADDISPYHCGLVSTRAGLWVVDLSGRGVVVNGERMRVAPLSPGAELWVGRFLIGCRHPATATGSGPTPPPVARALPDRAVASAPSPLKGARASSAEAPVAEDEVELGAAVDEADDLPNSHILADAFRLWGGPNVGGPPSNSVTVSGSGPAPCAVPVTPDSPLARVLGVHPDEPHAPLLRLLFDLHARMAVESERWLSLTAQLLARTTREHLPAVQQALDRIDELTTEIALLQEEAGNRALESALGRTPPPRATSGACSPISDTSLPPPERLLALQQERAARRQALFALLAGG